MLFASQPAATSASRPERSMKKRWVAAGMLEAVRSFRRVKGCAEMPALVAAVRH